MSRIETIVIHGGAWKLGDSIGSRASIRIALLIGYQALRKTGSALEGALAAHRAQAAVDIALRGSRRVGVIALDRKGNIGLGHTTPDMTWGWIRDGKEATR